MSSYPFTFSSSSCLKMMDVSDEAALLEVLLAVQIPSNQLEDRASVNRKGRVVSVRLNPCFMMQELPSALGDLAELQELYLFWSGHNFLHLSDDALGKIANLRVLSLRHCRSLTSLSPTIGTSLTSLRRLSLGGCNRLEDLSGLREARHMWIHLISLEIVSCPAVDLVKILTDKTDNNIDSEKREYFPSLVRLCLSRNSINGSDLAKLWAFVQRCPKVDTFDVSNNVIESFQGLAAKVTATSGKGSNQHLLRTLNLAGNPVMGTESQEAERQMMQILLACPRFESIYECGGTASTTPLTECYQQCFIDTPLYSPTIQHALDMNYISKGTSILSNDETTFPMSMWPFVLQRASKVSSKDTKNSWSSTIPTCQKCGCADGSLFTRREASVMFAMLQGPVLAARWNES
ncbi:MAG: hypothetical protein SGILL_004956 [Bacillariaceae sp.]